jgi:hypothetical protein
LLRSPVVVMVDHIYETQTHALIDLMHPSDYSHVYHALSIAARRRFAQVSLSEASSFLAYAEKHGNGDGWGRLPNEEKALYVSEHLVDFWDARTQYHKALLPYGLQLVSAKIPTTQAKPG